jgi:hypothetical protein
MASIRKEVLIEARPEEVWDAVRDWGSLHQRLVPGFATDCRVEDDARIVTFFTGAVIKELFISCDDEHRRLAWSIVDGPYRHHNASVQVLDGGPGRTRFVWLADVLPDAAAERTAALMERGSQIAKATLEAASAPAYVNAARRADGV